MLRFREWSLSLLLAACASEPPLQNRSRAADARILGEHCGRVGADLMAVLVANGASGDRNVCLSPASAGLALLMLLPGARGASAEQLREVVLPAGWDTERATAAARQLLERLHGFDGIALECASDAWLQRGFAVQPAYADLLRRDFAGGVRAVDFASDASGARRAVNEQMAKATHGMIRDAIDPLPAETRFLLTQVMWLQADWARPFQDAEAPHDFFCPGDRRVECAWLSSLPRSEYPYAELDDVQLVQVPYKDRELVLELAVPRIAAQLDRAVQLLRPESSVRRTVSYELCRVDLGLPRFRFESRLRLLAALRALGVDAITRAATADLGGLADFHGERAWVASFDQVTVLQVDAKGTTAAAATRIMGPVTGRGPTPVEVIADHPFAFALRDLRTGLILFAGQVVDPTEK